MKLHTVKQTAEILGLSERSIYRYLALDILKGARFGKAWMISAEDLQSFYDEMKTKTKQRSQERKTAKMKVEE